jgi:membrane protein DedA with SNARE-associated domain
MRTVTNFIIQHGLPLLFLVVMLESFGIPLPGETALLAFGVLASQGHYDIKDVIVVAAAGAIVGDNLGYWVIGRWGGRALFRRWKWLDAYAQRVLPRAEKLMERHGGKTVFFGRFITVLRYSAAWIAGLGRMNWWKFLFWNATGGIVWAAGVGLVAYYGGQAAVDAFHHYGIYAAIGIVAVVLVGFVAVHFGKKRFEEKL